MAGAGDIDTTAPARGGTSYSDELDAEAVDHARLTIAQRVAADHDREGDTEMGDDTARRDAWRNAQTATTVTGARLHDRVPPREHEGENHVPHGSQATDPANALPGHPAIPDEAVAATDEQIHTAMEEVANATFSRARYGEGRSIEDACAVVKTLTGRDSALSVAEIEAHEAEHPETVAKLRELETLIAGSDDTAVEEARQSVEAARDVAGTLSPEEANEALRLAGIEDVTVVTEAELHNETQETAHA